MSFSLQPGALRNVVFAPTYQRYLSGSGTYNHIYLFQCFSANATSGATFTVSGVTYTVFDTLVSGSLLTATGASAPPAQGTLTKTGGTGDATINFFNSVAPLYLRVQMVGGGGGAGGGGTGGSPGGPGTTGGDTTLNSTLLVANGGANNGGSGGAFTITPPIIGFGVAGANGSGGGFSGSAGNPGLPGQAGGSSFFGGSGFGGNYTAAGGAARANTGSGGGSGGLYNVVGIFLGNSGAGGGYVDVIIPSPAATYSYAVGAAGTGGAGAASGNAGGNGAAGAIYFWAHYQ